MIRKHPQARLRAKTALTRQLFERGWGKEQILTLFSLLDWLITLPEELVLQYDQEIKRIEEEKHVNYITSIEQLGIERGFQKGHQQGLHEGEANFLIRLLKHRFGDISPKYLQEIQEADHNTLLTWGERVVDAHSIEEVFI